MSEIEIKSAQVPILAGTAFDAFNVGNTLYLRLCGLPQTEGIPSQLKRQAFRTCGKLIAEHVLAPEAAFDQMRTQCPVAGRECPVLTRGLVINNPPLEYSIARVGIDAANEVWTPAQAREYYYEHQLSPLLLYGLPELAEYIIDPSYQCDLSFLSPESIAFFSRYRPALMDGNPQKSSARLWTLTDLYAAGSFQKEMPFQTGMEHYQISKRLVDFYLSYGAKPIERMVNFLGNMNILGLDFPKANLKVITRELSAL